MKKSIVDILLMNEPIVDGGQSYDNLKGLPLERKCQSNPHHPFGYNPWQPNML